MGLSSWSSIEARAAESSYSMSRSPPRRPSEHAITSNSRSSLMVRLWPGGGGAGLDERRREWHVGQMQGGERRRGYAVQLRTVHILRLRMQPLQYHMWTENANGIVFAGTAGDSLSTASPEGGAGRAAGQGMCAIGSCI
jgi:hypothetical protein